VFLRSAAAAGSLVVAPAFLGGRRGYAWAEGTSLFPLGVASGDPDDDSVVLWTRLAADPLAANLPNEPITVAWQVALDPGMRRIVRQGIAVARPETAHTVRLLVGQLPRSQWLYHVLDTRHFRTDQPAEDGFGTTDTALAAANPQLAALLEQAVLAALAREVERARATGHGHALESADHCQAAFDGRAATRARRDRQSQGLLEHGRLGRLPKRTRAAHDGA
jgi:phosphodiesterase/alkaline phosphatase D-like protein